MAEIASNNSRPCTAFFKEDGSFTNLTVTGTGTPYTFKVKVDEEEGPTALKGQATFQGSPSSQSGTYDVKLGEEGSLLQLKTKMMQP
ncbi:hypothetical protein FRC12_020212 [Ceratobasidium sp. 428]|nr:hypothetical protein FRC12_020212 [Ceratobasidium sp. 428]